VGPAGAANDLADVLSDEPGVDPAGQVRLVEHGEVVAILCDVRLAEFDDEPLRAHLADMYWVEQIARGHERVLDAVTERCTPIPMRLCTMYRDQHGLEEMLARDQEALVAGLDELRGKLEWGVKVFADARSAGRGPEADTGSPAAVSGTAYLESRVAERHADEHAQVELEQAGQQVYGELCAVSVADRLGAIQRSEVSGRDEPMILNAFYLVENAQHDMFLSRFAALKEAAASTGVALELTGPWPPYNFVPESVGGGL
jgi:hypothetical protein